MTVGWRGALLTGLAHAATAFPADGMSGVVRWNGLVRWADVVARSDVPASSVADREGVRR
ncbi:hypothetical protein [Streptomyces griseorubiginosus]|uniref:hypothetical protein n=1 Tax=Streptomyces griseorubiginosus TaxID=67304 RepID=UPI001AD647B4|nr:hypothetical protein [Streptomyces griseorubiginosus]MBO4259381.1 hypothetical protein [Streptomyces griseorubiginosus]